jgi:hypothetical protein
LHGTWQVTVVVVAVMGNMWVAVEDAPLDAGLAALCKGALLGQGGDGARMQMGKQLAQALGLAHGELRRQRRAASWACALCGTRSARALWRLPCAHLLCVQCERDELGRAADPACPDCKAPCPPARRSMLGDPLKDRLVMRDARMPALLVISGRRGDAAEQVRGVGSLAGVHVRGVCGVCRPYVLGLD